MYVIWAVAIVITFIVPALIMVLPFEKIKGYSYKHLYQKNYNCFLINK